MKWFLVCLAIPCACLGQSRDADFSRLADRYFEDVVFRYDPVQATAAGFHQYDTANSSARRSENQAPGRGRKKIEVEGGAFYGRGLSATVAADRDLVLAQIRGQLLSLESIRPWEKNPDVYSSN